MVFFCLLHVLPGLSLEPAGARKLPEHRIHVLQGHASQQPARARKAPKEGTPFRDFSEWCVSLVPGRFARILLGWSEGAQPTRDTTTIWQDPSAIAVYSTIECLPIQSQLFDTTWLTVKKEVRTLHLPLEWSPRKV